MIPERTVQQIIETAQVEEVVGDFVSLKKKGSNYMACCPFHNEKTPSFSVSPSKGIYKCFGCGEAGNSVKFLMEHEQMSFPDALRYLAKKYNIEIEEIETEEGKQDRQVRESLMIVNQFALSHFKDNLFKEDEGRSVALSYFRSRGFTEDIIQKFELGYSLESGRGLLKSAEEKAYNIDLAKELGLVREREGRKYDFFRGRVMFTIHNLSGKPIAFAGRTLSNDKKQPKYINSPETELYNKSQVLYGMHLAKRGIRKADNCFLVEGYTDVISLHQAGIENVVAASGTSLTEGQIRLVKRYSPNITLLFDGDAAGVKAALRGVDLVLEQGLNVKVVLLPEGEDPDSFVRAQGKSGFDDYISKEAKDFIFFKAGLLLEEAANDPIQRAKAIKEVIRTLSKIPDAIQRSLYVRECARLLQTSEQLIIEEMNKLKAAELKKKQAVADRRRIQVERAKTRPLNEANIDDANFALMQLESDAYEHFEEDASGFVHRIEHEQDKFSNGGRAAEGPSIAKRPTGIDHCEKELIRVLLEHGDKAMGLEEDPEELVAVHIITEIEEIPFQNADFKTIVGLYVAELEEGKIPNVNYFLHQVEGRINKLVIDLLASPYELSHNWEKKHGIFLRGGAKRYQLEVGYLLNNYKLKKVNQMIDENARVIQSSEDAKEQQTLLEAHLRLLAWKKELSAKLNMDIVR